MKMGIIGNEDEIALFRLAGITNCYSIEEFEKAINEVAILFITYDYAKKLKEKIFYHRIQKNLPIIVEIPSKRKEKIEDTIKRIIVRAVGVEIE